MSNKIRQYKLLLSLEEKKITDAMLAYMKVNQLCQNLEMQHSQLVDYRKEYYHRINDKDLSMSSQSLTLYYEFIDKLTLAVEEQVMKINLAKQQAVEKYEKYTKLKKKSEGLEKILSAEIESERNIELKAEQKQYDESASNQWHICRD